MKSLGFSANKSQALIDVSSAIRDQRLNLESLVKLDNQVALERLVKLKGVGRWTAEYVLLRGLGTDWTSSLEMTLAPARN